MREYLIDITQCRNDAYKYLEEGKINLFLKMSFFESDQQENFEDLYDCANDILYDAIIAEGIGFAYDNQDYSWHECLEDEIYKLLNKKGGYIIDNGYFELVLGGIVTKLTDYLHASYSIEYSVCFGVASVLIYTIGKLGINVWCTRYRKQRGIDNEEDK